MVMLTGLLMVIGIGTAWIFYRQFCEMSKQTAILNTQAKQAAADSIVSEGHTREQIGIAQKQADAAQKSVEALQEQMRVDQRAWIGVPSVENVGGSGDSKNLMIGNLILVVRNSGKTPALRMSGRVLVTKRKWTDPIPDFDVETRKQDLESKKSRNLTLQQQKERDRKLLKEHPEMAATIADFRRKVALLDAQIQGQIHDLTSAEGGVLAPGVTDTFTLLSSVQEGRGNEPVPRTIYVLGNFTYYDIFHGTPMRTTKYCLMNQSGTQFTFCPASNWMD